MRFTKLIASAAVVTVALLSANAAWAQRGGANAKPAGPPTDPRTARFGVWDNSTNPNNVMTYEAYEKGGSKLTVSNPSNPASDWSYVTLFDGGHFFLNAQTEALAELLTANTAPAATPQR